MRYDRAGSQGILLSSWEVGMRICFNVGSKGDSRLFAERRAARARKHEVCKINENTITNLPISKKNWKVRACGYSVDNGEEIEGVNCVVRLL
ncbi:MAG: hypothetical protein ACLUKN_07925 [Bacilli bacterium]